MAAKHLESDEYGYEWMPTGMVPCPTEEYYGICSCCHGNGEAPDIDRVGATEPCWACGGDGKSERVDSL